MKNKKMRFTSFLLVLALCLSMITPVAAATKPISTNYKLTGNEADDIVAVAAAQEGCNRDSFGFNADWCGFFLSWCAKKSGCKHVSPNITGAFTAIEYTVNNGLGEFYCFSDAKTNTTRQSIYNYLKTYNNKGHTISKTGMTRIHEVNRNNFTPKKGDIIIFLWNDDWDEVTQLSHVGFVRSDYNGKGTVYTVEGNNGDLVVLNSWPYKNTQIVGFVRPNYSNTSTSNKPATLSADVSNVTLELPTKTNQTIKLTLGGDLPNNCKLDKSISNSNIVSSEWVNYTSGTVVNVRISGKSAGTATVTYKVLDGNTQKVYAEKKVTVTVKEPSYTVKYDANGGSGAPSTQTKSYQKPLSIPSTQPTRSGYTFAGWATSPNGSVEYRPGVQYFTDKDITLYAVWTPVKVSISFERASYTVKQGEQVKINFTFTGIINGGRHNVANENVCKVISGGVDPEQYYGFVTCDTLAPGTTDVTIKLCDKNDNILATKSIPVTVEPIAPTTYTVRYNANGGTNAPVAQTKTHQKALTLSSAQPTRSGYTFAGWATSPNGSVQYRPGEQYSKDQDITLYAAWEVVPSKFSVSVRCNDYVPNSPDIMDVVKQSDTEYTCYLNYDKADDEIPAIFYLNAIVDGDKADTKYTWSTDYSQLLYPVPDGGNSPTARAIVYPNRNFGNVKITVTAVNGKGQTDSATIVFHIKELKSSIDNNTTPNSKTYFETLTPTSQSRYTGNMGDSFIDTIGRRNGNIDVNGNSYAHGLTAWVARWNYTAESSWVQSRYNLNANYKTLTGKVVLIKSQNETDFDTQLTISSGNSILYTKRLTPSTLPTEEFQIDISGVTNIEISFSDNKPVAGGTAFGLADLSLQ